MPDTQLEAVNPVVPCKEISSAVDFYTQQLGFNVSYSDDSYAVIGRERVEIHLKAIDSNSGNNPAGVCLRFATCDVDHLFSQFESLGVVDDATPITETALGTREFSVLDPDGNHLIFYSDLG